MVAAARHFGFEKEWSDYVDSNPGETIQELFYMLILFIRLSSRIRGRDCSHSIGLPKKACIEWWLR
jgi:hypothetical protein